MRNTGYVQKNRIHSLRKEKSLTQQQVADHCGVSRVAVAKWESGDTENLKPPNLFKLAQLFGVLAEEIALGTETGPMRPTVGQGTPQPPTLPPDEAALLASYRALPEKERALALLDLKYRADLAALEGAGPPAKQDAA